MMANFFMRDPEYTESLLNERGNIVTTAILISPSMSCNLQVRRVLCIRVRLRDSLTEDDVESIINQGEEIGSRV